MGERQIQLITFTTEFDDNRGDLTAIESGKDIPFEIKRAFYITAIPSLKMDGDYNIRGGHAHLKCEQVIICIHGSCSAFVDGIEYVLDTPGKGIYIPAGFMTSLTYFQTGSIVLVLCSEHYDKEDYVYSISAFAAARA